MVFGMLLSLLLGAMAYLQLGRAEDPSLTIKVMTIEVRWPGATVPELERLVVEKIQQTLQEVPHHDYVNSHVRPGAATLYLVLTDATRQAEVAKSWYQARKRLADLQPLLPAGVEGPLVNDDFGDTFGSIYAVHADGYDDVQIKQVLLSLRAQVVKLPDVSKTLLLGLQDPRFYVRFSQDRLAQLGVSQASLWAAVAAQNKLLPAGVVEGPQARIQTTLSGGLSGSSDLENVVLAVGQQTLRLGDVATVERGFIEPPVQSMRRNGERVTGLAVSMIEGGDVLRLGQDLDALMATLAAQLPAGISIEKIVDQPSLVKASVNEFLGHFLLAVVIVLAVSLLALGLRTGLVVALSVPLVLGLTFFMMWIMAIDLHRISLGALIIALGLLVDDAIIAVEMMQVKMEAGWDRLAAASFTWTSTAMPMLTGTLITAAGFVPVGFALSSTSEFTGAIFWVVGIALLTSWLVAVLFTPYLGFKLLPSYSLAQSVERPMSRRHQWLTKVIYGCVVHKGRVILITLTAFVASLWAFQFVPQQFFPDSPREEILVDVQLEEGASYAATLKAVEAVEAVLQADERVQNITAYVGVGSPRFYLSLDPETPKLNYAQLIVYPRTLAEAPALALALRQQLLAEFGHFRTRVYRLEMGPTVGYPVQFRVQGAEPDVVRLWAERVRDVMRTHPNVREVNLQWHERVKSMDLHIDQERARSLGLERQTIAAAVLTLLNGQTITQIREGSELIDVVVKAETAEWGAEGALGDLNLGLVNGQPLLLSQVATTEPGLTEGGRWLRDRLPTLSVRADVEGAQAPDVSMQLLALLQPLSQALPTGYTLETGGAIAESSKADAAIAKVVPVMLLFWAVFLMWQLQSFSRMFMVMLTAPLGLIGVSFTLLLTRTPFGFVATLGLIALAGMIMRNSIILIDQIDRDIAAGEAPLEAVVNATVRRTRPVVLTALAAILAMVPLVSSTLWGPMALSIMGGLAAATVLTLLFLPALYAFWLGLKVPSKG